MRIWLAALSVALSLSASSAWASPFGCWVSISADPQFDWVHTGEPWVGERTLYVQLGGIGPNGGFSRYEFSFGGTLEVVEIIPINGVVNEGTLEAPSFVRPECDQNFPLVSVEIRVLNDGTGGHLCVRESTVTGRNAAYYCNPDYPPGNEWVDNWHIGFSSDGSMPCQGGPVSVETETWSSIKGSYRSPAAN